MTSWRRRPMHRNINHRYIILQRLRVDDSATATALHAACSVTGARYRETDKTVLAEVCTVPVLLVMEALRSRCGHCIFVLFLMVALWNRTDHYTFILWFLSIFFMVALYNRADHYIFALWFLSSSFFFFLLFFFPRLISAAVEWMSTILPHMVWP